MRYKHACIILEEVWYSRTSFCHFRKNHWVTEPIGNIHYFILLPGSPRICLSSGGTSMTLWRALPPWTWWHNIVSDEVALLLPQLVWMASTGLCWSWFCTDISSCHLCPPLTLVFNLVLVLMLWASCSCGSCQKCPKYEYVLLDWQFDECLQKMMELLMYDRHDPCIFIVLERWILGGFQFSVKCYI